MNSDVKKIVAVIVTYNRLDLLKECIFALTKSKYKVDILIVNNNSQDGTREFLLEVNQIYKDVKFHIYNLDENLNGAGGFNYGILKACTLNYDYIWLMDDDCIVNENSLSKLVEIDEELQGKYGFLSSKVVWKDNSICKTNVQRNKIARRVKDFKSKLVKVDFASFVSLFVKKKDVINIGLPIKEFIIWTDDLEWTRRLTYKKLYKNAMKGYLCNESVVMHKCANNFGVSIVKDTKDRIERYKYIYRNDVYCFRREGILGHMYMLIRNTYHILKILLFSPYDKIKRIKILIRGYIEGYKFFPNIEYINNI